MVQLRNRTSK